MTKIDRGVHGKKYDIGQDLIDKLNSNIDQLSNRPHYEIPKPKVKRVKLVKQVPPHMQIANLMPEPEQIQSPVSQSAITYLAESILNTDLPMQ